MTIGEMLTSGHPAKLTSTWSGGLVQWATAISMGSMGS